MAEAEVETETAQTDENDDSWLYGDSATGVNLPDDKTSSDENKESQQEERADGEGEGEEKDQDENEENDDSHFNDEHFEKVSQDDQDQENGDADSQDNGDTDSDDSDNIKVTIGEIKSGPQAYASLNIKRGVGLVATGAEKTRIGPTAGKVTLEDFDGPGSINGVPALEFNIENIEDKPWNKPGADISDYFNYGFNEITWSAYCDRQRRMRVNEAGVGLHNTAPPRPMQSDMRRPLGPMRDDGAPIPPINYQARENTIQVMTAERREYGRSWRTDGPPEGFAPMATQPEHYYPPPHQPYEESWGHSEPTGWTPTEIKELTPGPMGPPAMGPPVMVPPPVGMNAPPIGPPHGAHPHMPPSHMMPAPSYVSPYRSHSGHLHERDRERDRDRDRERERTRERDDRDRRERDRREDEEREREHERSRSRSIKPDRIREKSYRRERSRSRSRRHKSRSRSPRQRERSRERERSPRTRERSRERDPERPREERARDQERPRERERSRERDRERSVKPKSKETKEKDEEK